MIHICTQTDVIEKNNSSALRLNSDEFHEGGCPLSVDKLPEIGKEAGFKGDILLAFVRKQQSCDRERTARKRSLERRHIISS